MSSAINCHIGSEESSALQDRVNDKEPRVSSMSLRCAFSFTSFGANIDYNVASGVGPFTFRIHGQAHH